MSDYISRNAIIQVLNTMDRYVADELTLCDTEKKFPRNEVFIVDDVYEEIVEQLPPADVISKKELYHKISEAYSKGHLTWGANEIIKDIIGECHSVENTGKWIEWKGRNGRYQGIPICSNCHTGFPIIAKDYKFCPECGADMRGET